MKASLLQREPIEEMLNSADVGSVIAVLDRTDYKEDFAEPALKYSGADLVEFALSRNLARRARKVISFTPKEAVPAVLSVLEKWDVYNLRVILLSKHLGHPPEETAPFLVPAGAFKPSYLKKMLENSTVEDIVEFLRGTEYWSSLLPLLPEYRKSRNIQPLLNSMERCFYSNLSRSIPRNIPDGGQILRLVRADIDNRNVMNILRGKRDGLADSQVKQFMIPGGALSQHELGKLIQCKSLEDAVKAAGERLKIEGGAIASFREGKSLTAIEVELERRVMALGLKTLRTSVLSPGAIVGYLYLKENEMLNIRKIVRAKEFSLPADKIRSSMVIVS